MRKFIISALLLCSGVIGYAQLLNVSSVEKMSLPETAKPFISTMSPEGSFVVVSDLRNDQLSKYDFATGQITPIAAKAIGYDVKVLNDGSQVVYRETVYGNDRLRRTALKSVDLATGRQTTIVEATRNLQGVAVAEGNVFAVNNGKMSSTVLKGAKVAAVPTASIIRGQLCITVNGKTTQISPNGVDGQSYLWPSVSPDGTKVVYYLAATGCFVCNIDGSNPVALGGIRAPQWYNNNIIVGMRDRDNGHAVVASALVASSIDGKVKQTLVEESAMAMYPSATADGSKISYTTPAGELYIVNIK